MSRSLAGTSTPRGHERCKASIVLFSTLILGISGCHRAAPPGSLAEVNGAAISAARVEEYDRLHPQAFSGESGEQRRLDVLNQVIMEEILEQRVRASHLEASDEDASEKLPEMRASYTQEEFAQQLKSANLTMDDMQRQVHRDLSIDRLLNKDVYSRINITDADLSNYYTAHEDEFHLSEPRYHLAYVVVATLPDAASNTRQDALRTIQMAHLRIEEGEDFSTLVNELANVKTARVSGDADLTLSQSQLDADPLLREHILKMLPGQSTEVLQSPDGDRFAIYKLISREPAGLYGFNDPRVQQYIREKLRSQRGDLLKAAYMDMLRNQAHVRNYYAESLLH